MPATRVVCLIGLILSLASSSAAQPRPRQVLLLNSFERGSATENLFASMLRRELSRRSPDPINYFEISLQPALAVDEPREEAVVEYLGSTFDRELDLVITLGGPAADFARRHRRRLFPATPLFLTAMDNRWVEGHALSDSETALGVVTDPARIIEDMQRLLPDLRTVAVVIGASPIERLWRDELARRLRPFEDRLTFVWWDELSFDEMLQRSATLPSGAAIFYALLAVDAKGVGHEEERTLAALHATATAPMFGLYDLQVGHGIVGGSVLSVEDAVQRSADVAARILRGETPGTIKPAPLTHGAAIFDWRELQRWNIPESRLPTGHVIRFRSPSAWVQYRAYILSAAGILGLQTALIVGLMVQRSRRRRVEAALRDSEGRSRAMAEENQDLAGRLIGAQEAERSRIARDLHDDVSQQLASVGIVLSQLRRRVADVPHAPPDLNDTVRTLQDRTSALTESVRNLSHELHPSVLVHAGLVATLRRHSADVERVHGLHVRFTADDDVTELPPDLALCLFRVAQEAMANIVRHARARTVHVELRTVASGIELQVTDDGVGFKTRERSRNGLGLRSIEERVRLVGGVLTVASEPGAGTRVAVRLRTGGQGLGA